MVLAELLEDVPVIKLYSAMYGKMVLTQDVSISNLRYDSRRVEQNDLFVAIRGTATDGHVFIDSAVNRGARVVVVQDDEAMPDAYFMHAGVIKILVEDSRKALAIMAANFYRHPSRRLTLIGVTGTNGKTTTTHLIKSILEAAGGRVGLIGTIAYSIGDEVLPATHTTPESLELNQMLDTMSRRGCTAAVMEVSSHSLAMSRVYGQQFGAAVFTNLTQDHLDYHGTMEGYFAAKRLLFSGLSPSSVAVSNGDDAYGIRMVEGTAARTIIYSMSAGEATVRDLRMGVEGLSMTVAYKDQAIPVVSTLTGRFNAANILAACAAGMGLGVDAAHCAAGIRGVKSVRGRFEQIHSPQGWTAIVDYAHTPDALQNCLGTIREILPAGGGRRIVTVFGCGGNRDAGKRPVMGRIASSMSDLTIVTSDNPRNEDPGAIIADIMKGTVAGRAVSTEPDRRKAIRKALVLAAPGDVILIAGKGHEQYQIVRETRSHFDDREEVEAYIGEHQ
jgi:UDP-N-acetylmuramoyl-L-alanyl-D-glutamate--2,6-diaminopimelate ligase